MRFWNGGGWAWWQAGLMWVAMIAFLALLIWAVYALVASVTRRPGQPDRDQGLQPGSGPQRGSARRILDERRRAGGGYSRAGPAGSGRDAPGERGRGAPSGPRRYIPAGPA
jgi:hypothetical protein